ncbi:hypothetical protein SAMN05660284_01422 [Formivibrio citricus]|uniref:DUF456 domain-containing protein n=1 Tax=Formivibrio citricus TaxID=83765 RepID=A0A1I4YQB0_9NEIS|nr:DUF456 family protein [Formivibrio citricus]SFN40228.1 hypothetical protein SAMN05660284_01422 [Formivibrio citricus]
MDLGILWWLLAFLLVIGGLAGTLLPILPSTPMILAGMLLAAGLDDFQRVGWMTFALLVALVVFSQLMDVVAGALGAKKAGASSLAIWGALVGSVLGIFAGLPGLLLGPFVGAAVGEYLARQDAMQAGKVGVATLLGFVIGAVAKVASALAMLGIFAFAWFL